MQIVSQNFNNKFQPNKISGHKAYFTARKEIHCDKFEKSNSKNTVAFAGVTNPAEISKLFKPVNKFLVSLIPNKPSIRINETISIEEIQRIKQGELGRIRGPEELSPADVLKVMRHQLKPYSTQEIESIVNSFKPEDRKLALKTLQKMSQYGNMQSLKHLAKSLSDISDYTPIITDEGVNIVTNLKYLGHKGSFSRALQISNDRIEDLHYHRILVLDENLLNRLESNKNLVDTIKSLDYMTIAYPEGWINGNNPFNHSTVQEIRQRASTILKEARIVKNNTGFSDSEAVDEVLNSPILERINKLGLTANLKIIKNEDIVTNPNAEHIAELLAPLQISEKEMLEQMREIPPNYRQAALEILSRETRVFSPRTLNEMAKKQQNNILELARQKGIPQDNIYYFVPKLFRSYGMVTMQHQIANNLPNEKIITEWHKLDELEKIEKSMVVVLDDVAASGESLFLNYKSVKTIYSNGEIVIAPTISTIKAENYFKSLSKSDNKLTYLPGKTIASFNDNPYFLSLSDSQKMLIEKVIGDNGWSGDGLNIAFPYMSPDNNNAMFATLFAPKLLLGGKEAAKNESWEFLENAYRALDQEF